MLERPDVHFTRGPFGKLHVRYGKAAHTSGPRPRWVPMLDGLDLVLRCFEQDARGRFPDSSVLFPDESGQALARGTVRNLDPDRPSPSPSRRFPAPRLLQVFIAMWRWYPPARTNSAEEPTSAVVSQPSRVT